MAKAFICDMSKTTHEGEGVSVVDVVVNPTTKLQVRIFTKTGPSVFEQGVFGPEGEAKVKEALARLGTPDNSKQKA